MKSAIFCDGGIVEVRQGFSHRRALIVNRYSREVVDRLVVFSRAVKALILGSSL
jgi:hypothetical protein